MTANLAEKGKVDEEIRSEVKALSDKFEKTVTDLAQKMDNAYTKTESSIILSAGEEFVKSEQFKACWLVTYIAHVWMLKIQ